MEFLLYFLLPFTLSIYVIGTVSWAFVCGIKYLDSWDSDKRQEAAQRLLKAPIWPIILPGMFRKFIKELKMAAKGEEK